VRRLTKRAGLPVGLALMLGLSACGGGPPTSGEEPVAGGGGEEAPVSGEDAPEAQDAGEAQAALDEVNAELDGLDRDARRERLIELAQEEGGEVSFYGSTNIDDIGPVLEAFEDDTDISVSHYRAGASTVMNRMLQEADAGFAGSDVVQINGPEMLVLEGEGLLLELDTPIADDIVEAGRFDTWLAPYVNAFVVGWNTDLVSEDEVPTSYEETFQDFKGSLAMEVDDYDWFATLVEKYFVEEKGMTEEEAVDLFKEAASGASLINGHSLGSELLVAGEYDVHATIYHHHTARHEGAPLGWQPPVEPIVVRPNGVGIVSSTARPATSLLLLEYMLTDGQPLLIESGRTPGSTKYEGGLPEDLQTIGVDLQELEDNNDKWRDLYEEVIQESGSEVQGK
jgi:iron(III) transport system substrate-binding protein